MALNMKIIVRTLMFIFIIVVFSCEDTGLFINCSDCSVDEPESAELNVMVSVTDMPVLIRIYEGELEDSVIYDFSEFRGSEYRRIVSLNKKYTVTATYSIGNSQYISIDAATPRVKYTEDQCSDPCYFLYDRKIDLRLKYTID
jgi:hypothetical protein